MGYLNSFRYEKAADMFQCSLGEHPVCIKDVKEETSRQGTAMVVFYCNVKDEHWNGVQLRLFAMEGQYFDRQLSRLSDCFGVPYTQATNLGAWINKVGTVRFDHWKYDPKVKKNVEVPELQNHLIAKAGFKQPEVPQQTQPVQQQPAQSAGSYAQEFPEDIPF